MIDKPDSDYSRVLEFPRYGVDGNDSSQVPFGEKPRIPDYTVLRHIGAGEFGDVWLVRNSLDRQFYAMKILREDAGIELAAIREFKRRVADHPNVVPIGHVGESNGLTYYIMPLADNALANGGLCTIEDYEPMTLAELVTRNGKLPASKVVEIATGILSGLEAIHTAGAVHRDIKPDNIMQFDGKWRLTDPGLMTSLDASDLDGGADCLSDSGDTQNDIRSVAITLERIFDLREESGASKHLLMKSLQRAKLDEIDPQRFHSAQQMLASIRQAKTKTEPSFRIPLLIASHLVVGYLALTVGWQLALAPSLQPVEQIFNFPKMEFATSGVSYDECTPIEDGEIIYDCGFIEEGSFVTTNVFVASTATYELSTRGFFGCERGIFELKIDEESVGHEFDMYAPEGQDHYVTVYHDRVELTKGWHTLKYELASVNKAARCSNGAFVNLRITPIKE